MHMTAHEVSVTIIGPAELADDGLGGFAQVGRILQHAVQDLGVNLLRL